MMFQYGLICLAGLEYAYLCSERCNIMHLYEMLLIGKVTMHTSYTFFGGILPLDNLNQAHSLSIQWSAAPAMAIYQALKYPKPTCELF